MTKLQLKAIESWLDSRFNIALHTDERMGNTDTNDFLPNNPDYIYYKAGLNLTENIGLTWTRNDNGLHRVFK